MCFVILQFICLPQITFSEENNKNGIFREHYDNGNLWAEETWKDGKLNGLTREFYKSGELRGEWLYGDDELNGLGRTYYKTGQLQSETNYKNDKEDGVGREYYKNGQLTREGEYKDGEYIKQKEFYANGWLRENKSSPWGAIIPFMLAIYFANRWGLVRRGVKDMKVRDVFSSKTIMRSSICLSFWSKVSCIVFFMSSGIFLT